MSNIIHSEFPRILKNKAFRISLIFFVLCAAYFVFVNELSNYLRAGLIYSPAISYGYTLSLLPMPFASAVVISLFIGREFGDGTIENKISSGHSRAEVYFGYLIVCLFSGVMMELTYLISYAVFELISMAVVKNTSEEIIYFQNSNELISYARSHPITDINESSRTFVVFEVIWSDIIKGILIGLCITAVFSSLFLMIAMILRSKSRTVIISLVAAIALTAWGSVVDAQLTPPLTFDYDTSETADQAITYTMPERGSNLSGPKKTFLMALDNILPYNQTSALLPIYSDRIPSNANFFPLYDLIMTSLNITVGYLIFKKKDLGVGGKHE